ncbi:YgcG family protein [Erwinia sp. Eh17-17]|uniref:TPM domain-containing protein n=1 Tax=Erwinia sp. Eh17-17 TaxID=3080330 RepID=UPI00320B53B9
MRYFTPVLLFCLSFTSVAATVAVPTLQQRVTDNAGVLSASEVQQMTRQIMALEKKTGHQLAVLAVETTGDDSIEQYATRVFDAWKLGDKARDDGLLLVMAKTDRTVRIEVGYGLEGDFTDVQASQAINGSIIPHFKQGAYGEGLVAGVQAISRQLGVAVEGDAPAVAPRPAAAPVRSSSADSISLSAGSIGLWLLGMMVLPFFFLRRNAFLRALIVSAIVTVVSLVNTLLSSGIAGVSSDNIGLLFGGSLMMQLVIASIIGSLFGGGGGTRERSDDSSDDRSYSSRDSDSDSSGGGFSGGGGRSGGGGASGKW